MLTRPASTTLSLALAAGFTASASAAPLTTFVFDTGDQIDERSPFTGGSTSSADNVDITSGLVAGPGFRGLNGVSQFRAFDFIDEGDTGSLAEAIAQGEFLSFTVDAADGSQLDLAGGSLVFANFGNAGGGANRIEQATLFSSVTGFTAGSQLSTVTVSGGVSDLTLDLPDLATLNGLTDPIEFRVLFSRNNAPTNTGGGLELKDSAGASVVLNGEVNAATPVPEPASLALVGLGSLLILGRRRGNVA